MGRSRPPFSLYFRLFNTVDSKQMFNKSLPMTGFEPRISGVGADRSTNRLFGRIQTIEAKVQLDEEIK